MDSNINQESRRRYEKAALAFMAFVREHGNRVEDAGDLDYWFAYYAHTAYMAGRPSRSELEKALAGLEQRCCVFAIARKSNDIFVIRGEVVWRMDS